MIKIILLAGLLLPYVSMAQCPSSVNLTSTSNCGQATLTVQPANSPVKIVWNKDGSPVASTSVNTNPVIVTVAGGNGSGSASNQFYEPMGVAVDGLGNVYIADAISDRVQKWAPGATSGVTVAGGNGGGNAANQFDFPLGIFLDNYGNLYVVDDGNSRIQKWAPGATSGVTVAGGNGQGPAGNQLDNPTDIFVDATGNIYIADYSNQRIQKWAPGATTGITVAGGNGRGSAANQFSEPDGVFVDGAGNIYVADQTNCRIQKWAPGATSGVTVAGGNGPGPAANQFYSPTHIYVDGAGNIFVVDFANWRIQLWVPGATSGVTVAGGNGKGSASNQFSYEMYMAVDNRNDIYISDRDNYRVQRWTTVSDINTSYTAATPGTYTATVTDGAGCTVTSNPQIVDAAPAVTISSSTNNCVGALLKTNTADNISQIVWYQDASTAVKTANATVGSTTGVTIAGGNISGATANQFDGAAGLYMDGNGNLYITDGLNNRIQKWAPGATSGVTVAGGNGAGAAANQFNWPNAVFVDGFGNIYITEQLNNRVQKWAPGATSGVTVAGGNGQGTAANQFFLPTAVFVDGSGNIYVNDELNYRVQKWAPGATSGVTVAGGNGRGSAANQLDNACGMYRDAAGNLYIADAGNNRIQKWAPGATSGITVAGGNGYGPAADQFANPIGVFVDGGGNIYVVDNNNNRVQKWAPGATTGMTVAGGNGQGSAANQLYFPYDVLVDNSGNIYISDHGDRIQKWAQSMPPDNTYQTTTAGTYTAYITTPGGCTVTSNPVVIAPSVTPSISVAASATVICAGVPVTFTAAASGGGANPVYQWQVNNSLTGTNDIHFVASGLTDGAKVSCTITSSAACPATPTTTSNSVVLTVNPIVTPSVMIKASVTTVCTNAPVTFIASPVNGGPNPAFTWQVNGVAVTAAGPGFTSNSLQDGDKVSLLLGSDALCSTNPTALSNIIPVTVVKDPGSTVSITASSSKVCSAASVSFTATATNAGNTPAYQWQVNGMSSGGNSPLFTDSRPANGDIVTCTLTSNAVCPSALSNSIALMVNPSPAVAPNQVFPISQGQDLTLQPDVTGNISSYSWTPAYGLSDPAIADPVANPSATTDYTLTVTTAEGCEATGTITVKVYTPLHIPNAFTPNGDGKNDIFYVMGGPAGSVIRDFSVFNRWGQKVFQVHGVAPGDPANGWNGYLRGSPAPPGAYVYVIGMRFADGKIQTIQGTVMLIR